MFKGILSEIILKQTYFEEIDLFVKEKIGFQPLPVKKIKKIELLFIELRILLSFHVVLKIFFRFLSAFYKLYLQKFYMFKNEMYFRFCTNLSV